MPAGKLYVKGISKTDPLGRKKRTVANIVRSELAKQVDKKNVDTNTNITLDATATNCIYLQPLAVDVPDTANRIGSEISCLSLQVKGKLDINPAGSSDIVRIMVVQDRSNRGANLTLTELLEFSNSYSFKKPVNNSRFRVLRDKVFTLDIVSKSNQFFKMNIPLRGMKSRYTGVAGTVADARENQLFILYLSETEANKSSGSISTRVWFTDA